jgi:hypothetical protein
MKTKDETRKGGWSDDALRDYACLSEFVIRMAAEPCIRFPAQRGCLDYPQPCWPCQARQLMAQLGAEEKR